VNVSLSDNALLLQALAHRVRFLSGRAMQDVTEHLSGTACFSQPLLLSHAFSWEMANIEWELL